MNKDEFKEILNEVLHEHRSIDDERHSMHHDYIELQMKKAERHADFWQKFKLSFLGTLATSVVAVLIWIGKLVLEAMQHGSNS